MSFLFIKVTLSPSLFSSTLLSLHFREGMADLATVLIEIARKRGYDDGGGEELVKVKRPPITLQERTIQVSKALRSTALHILLLHTVLSIVAITIHACIHHHYHLSLWSGLILFSFIQICLVIIITIVM